MKNMNYGLLGTPKDKPSNVMNYGLLGQRKKLVPWESLKKEVSKDPINYGLLKKEEK